MPNNNVRAAGHVGTGVGYPIVVGTAIVSLAFVSLAVVAPRVLGAVLVLGVLILAPAVVLALVLRTIKLKDRHAYLRMARPNFDQALFPAAFGNSSGGRNVS